MSQDTTGKKSLALAGFLGAVKDASPLAKSRGLGRASEENIRFDRIEERHGVSTIQRPNGCLIWLHGEDLAGSLPLIELMGRIRQIIENVRFLLTTSENVPDFVITARLPSFAIHQYAPYDTTKSVGAFLDHWKPDICLWADNKLPRILLRETARRTVPMVYLNAGLRSGAFKRMRWVPGLAGPLLDCFTSILAVDDTSAAQFLKLGMKAESVSSVGCLREGSAPLSCNEADKSQIAKELHGRPVWLAAHVAPEEMAQIAAAHIAASRLSHRLVMILSPKDLDQKDALVQYLSDNGRNVACRSDRSSLTPHTDVLLADVPGELGLWYRVASVSFIGCSLSEHGGKNPYEAAALGSAIIHGPNVDNFADTYYRLAEAGAAIEVLSPSSLAEAINECLSPDKAAQMAHAAWQVSSEGADTTDRVVETVLELLPFAEVAQ